ncbi:hypothetical protein HOK51_01955 [Candidatus Woesearchaeota archaeon]|jgi:hypothetical protein|nr:hypothetical protein [Candidatus Woesearchaeota archaeon]MBT6518580.1 hypothetical protein [Candidatus Woesearchaeota archaeon]MBT7367445.1 hypothetical protein [Candidatus Woesearchaeota archaeon]
MRPKELLKAIDHEIDVNIKREKKFSVDELVESYDMHAKYRPVVKQYVSDVKKLFAETGEKLASEADGLGESLGCLGYIVAVAIGAGAGFGIGLLTGDMGTAKEFAGSGAGIGLFAELIFSPAATVMAHKYINSELKSCEEPRAIYRNKTLAKLDNLVPEQRDKDLLKS